MNELEGGSPLAAGTVLVLPDRWAAEGGLDLVRRLRKAKIDSPAIILGSPELDSLPDDPSLGTVGLVPVEGFGGEAVRGLVDRLASEGGRIAVEPAKILG